MGDKYIIVTWPESQDFIGKENCHLINDDKGIEKYGSSAYFVREDVYNFMIWFMDKEYAQDDIFKKHSNK